MRYKETEGYPTTHVSAEGTGTSADPWIPEVNANNLVKTSPTLSIPFHTNVASSTLATAPTAIDDYTFDVASGTSFAIGQYLTIYSTTSNRFFQAYVTAVSTNTITVNTPLDFAFQIGDQVSVGSTNMAVDGSSTPVIFTLRGPDPGISMRGHITRFVLTMTTTGAPGWGDFGDGTALAKGVVMRRTDGFNTNIWMGRRTNAELAQEMYDFEAIDQTKFGVYGLKGRMTLGGESKMGTVIDLAVDEDIEIIIQDKLDTASEIIDFNIVAQGHVVPV